MAIITHERPVTIEAPNQEPKGEQITRARFTYDPDKLPTLTADTMKGIEDAIADAEGQNAGPEELHKLVAERLEAIGIDPQTVADGAIVVRMEGLDGKHDVRAIIIDYNDFGTCIHDAELVSVQAETVESEADIQKTEQEGREQDRAVEVILADIRADMQNLELLIAENGEKEKKSAEFVDDTILGIRKLSNLLREGEPLKRSEVEQFVEQALKDMWNTLNKDADRHNEEQRKAIELTEELDIVRQQSNRLDAAHQATLESVVKQASGRAEEILTNRAQVAGASAAAALTARQAFGVGSEMLYSEHGGEAYAEDLKKVAITLEQAVSDSRMLQKVYTSGR